MSLPPLLFADIFFFPFVIRPSTQPWLAWNSLCRPSWPLSLRDLPTSASQMLRSKAYTTMVASNNLFWCRVLLCSSDWTPSTVLLPLLPKCWGYRSVTPHLADVGDCGQFASGINKKGYGYFNFRYYLKINSISPVTNEIRCLFMCTVPVLCNSSLHN